MFEKVEEELKWVVDGDVIPCYWIDDWVFLPYLEESRAARLVEEEKQTGSTPITELQKWSPTLRPDHRLTWVLLWGLPQTVWAPECMEKLVEGLGEFIEVDGYVEDRKRMDVARVLIRTNKRPTIQVKLTTIIDEVEHDIDVVEDSPGTRVPAGYHRPDTWFPPSPFSTQPNTPFSAGVGSPATQVGSDALDGGSDNHGDDRSNHRGSYSLNPSSYVHWVQPNGCFGVDWSAMAPADVDQSKMLDHQHTLDAGPIGIAVPSNGHIPQNGNVVIDADKGRLKACMQKEKGSAKVFQRGGSQHRDLLVDTLGINNSCTEGEMEEDNLPVTIPPQSNVTLVKENPKLSTPSGQKSKETEGVMGPRIMGPTDVATKVYVRRKEVLDSRGKAQCSKSVVNPLPALTTDSTSTSNGALVDRQYDLVKEMGLTHGHDALKIKELMMVMDTNDNKVAAEMGSKYQQS
ncbi:hypothetical protein GmHk_16G046348 [Glycine max]|nr:hypothetical protein GmHk_16G046348 [Glycine max]